MASTDIGNWTTRVGRVSGRARQGFRRWRRGRPFWGGLLTILGGVEILLLPSLKFPLVVQVGIAGVSGLLAGILMVVMGLSVWIAPHYRVFAGIATILLSLASFLTSNLGGFLIGMLLGLVGGSLACAWAPVTPRPSGPATGPEPGPEPALDADAPDAPLVSDDAAAAPTPASGERGDSGAPVAPNHPAEREQPAEPGGSTERSDGPSSEQRNPPPSAEDGPSVEQGHVAGRAHGAGAPGQTSGTPGEPGGAPAAGGGHPPLTLLGPILLALALLLPLTADSNGLGSLPRLVAAPVPTVNAAVPVMHADTVDMSALTFGGVVVVTTMQGPLRTLKFSMDQVVMHGYTLDVPDGPDGGAVGLSVGTLTLRSGVDLYTTSMSGLLAGAVPVTFTPDAPPPVVPSALSFTDFTCEQVFVRSDSLDAAGLREASGNT
ncbi:MAG TPA: DUF6114 domain-containing protein [Mycobacteriales bacterium]